MDNQHDIELMQMITDADKSLADQEKHNRHVRQKAAEAEAEMLAGTKGYSRGGPVRLKSGLPHHKTGVSLRPAGGLYSK